MGRPSRLEIPGLTYHVYNRGNRRAAIFHGPTDYRAYLRDLERLCGEHGARCIAFCLMPNHTHQSLRADGEPLSVLMHRLALRQSKRFNRAYGTTGRLYESRYKAEPVGSADYLIELVRYIHLNPVRAGLVKRPEDWPFSSHRAYLGQTTRSWVFTEEVLERLGGADGYRRLMRGPEPAGEEQAPLLRAERRRDHWSDLALVQGRRERPGPWRRHPPAVAVELAAGRLAVERGWDLEVVRGPGRGSDPRAVRRQLAAALREEGYRLREIAQVLGRKVAAVGRLLERVVEDGPPPEADVEIEL